MKGETVTPKAPKDQPVSATKAPEGSTSRIRAVVERAEKPDEDASVIEQIRAVQGGLKKKDRKELTEAALAKYFRSEILKPYQAELIKLQQHIERTKRKAIILFDGRDASGKGGTIKRFTEHMNPRGARVVALEKPSDRERTEWYFQRYAAHLPAAGEIVFFDRSWYNRAMVEPVMGFCTDEENKRFLKDVPLFERMLVKGGIKLFKFYFSVSKKEQLRRFKSRHGDLLKQYKISAVDEQAQELWDQYTVRKFQLLSESKRTLAPWTIVRSDIKKLARLNCIR